MLRDIYSCQFPIEGDPKFDRALAVMLGWFFHQVNFNIYILGNVIGDALGAPNEFSDVRYGVRNVYFPFSSQKQKTLFFSRIFLIIRSIASMIWKVHGRRMVLIGLLWRQDNGLTMQV